MIAIIVLNADFRERFHCVRFSAFRSEVDSVYPFICNGFFPQASYLDNKYVHMGKSLWACFYFSLKDINEFHYKVLYQTTVDRSEDVVKIGLTFARKLLRMVKNYKWETINKAIFLWHGGGNK